MQNGSGQQRAEGRGTDEAPPPPSLADAERALEAIDACLLGLLPTASASGGGARTGPAWPTPEQGKRSRRLKGRQRASAPFAASMRARRLSLFCATTALSLSRQRDHAHSQPHQNPQTPKPQNRNSCPARRGAGRRLGHHLARPARLWRRAPLNATPERGRAAAPRRPRPRGRERQRRRSSCARQAGGRPMARRRRGS